jgi:hypothetical protein
MSSYEALESESNSKHAVRSLDPLSWRKHAEKGDNINKE